MRQTLLAALTAVVALNADARAISTGFEDLTVSTQFTVGSTIASGGMLLDVVKFNGTGFPISVRSVPSGSLSPAGGTGKYLSLPNSVAISWQLPSGASQVLFSYGAFCCNSGMVVNGVASSLATGLFGLDGSTIGGVAVRVVPGPIGGGQRGTAILTGSVTSLVVGGTEFAIDNVNIAVTGLVADFDATGAVDGGDFLAWQRLTPGPSLSSDLSGWQVNFGGVAGPLAIIVAEPRSFLLAALAAMSLRRSLERN